MLVDLHTHSTASDGTQPPAELVAEAAEVGLDVVAITDHDTTSGWGEASEAAVRAGVALVPGVEVSCQAGGISVHLLAYLHDPTWAGLVDELDRARASRRTRAARIVAKLAVDLPITFEDVLAATPEGATLGRPHIADALVARRLVGSRDEAFARFLHAGSPYYAVHYAPDAVRAVRLVRAAGGVPVMAHPFAGQRGYLVDDEVVAELAEAGLAGLEVNHPDHDEQARRRGLRLAAGLGLLVTGASDYHGSGKANRLGQCLTPASVLAAIEEQGHGTGVVRG
ncbi:MAG TPA: PHP domain-containing protein [Dermatophilaceae bacterium]|nr:PHP domain-containing protein [Dermatophilaceae bacterium]